MCGGGGGGGVLFGSGGGVSIIIDDLYSICICTYIFCVKNLELML